MHRDVLDERYLRGGKSERDPIDFELYYRPFFPLFNITAVEAEVCVFVEERDCAGMDILGKQEDLSVAGC